MFKKRERQTSQHVVKATGKKAATLDKLRSFLDAQEPEAIQWLMSCWKGQQAAITYKELREAILSGGMSQKQLDKWQKDYAKLVNEKLAPQWEKAMATAAAAKKAQYPYFVYNPSAQAAQDYIKQHGTDLITNLTIEQKRAVEAIVARINGSTTDSMSRYIRPIIGLTKPQATANLKYYNTVCDDLMKAHPRMTQESAEKKARTAAAKYAGKQHRYRAQNIARTELADAYNHGDYFATKDAQAQGYIGDCNKIWLTADDERVCPSCGVIDNESVNMDTQFSIGKPLPPAHPSCRCAVAYEEISTPISPAPVNVTPSASPPVTTQVLPTSPATPTAPATPTQTSTAAPKTTKPKTVKPSPAAQNPLPATGDPITPEPEPNPGGVGLKATEVFGDLSVIPVSSNGVPVRSDSRMIEGLNLTARKISVNGARVQDYYEISGKLTGETWEAAAKNIQKRGHASKIDFEATAGTDGQYLDSKVVTSGGRTVSLDGYKLLTTDKASFEVYSDYSNKRLYGFGGYFRARVPVSGDIKKDTKAMNVLLDKTGLTAITSNPTDADELILKKSRLAWQHAPSRVSEYESLTGAQREKKLDAILKAAGIDEKRIKGMELREVYPGYSTYVDTAATDSYKKAGLVNVWAGVTNSDALVSITKSGFIATNSRITSGMKMYGASPEDDMETGGSDNVFTRIGVNSKSKAKYGSSYLGGKYRVLIDPSEMNRTDWYAYHGDSFGNSHSNRLSQRDDPVNFIKSNKDRYKSGNEIMFRRGISPDKFIGVSCETQSLRQEILNKYKAAGIKEINGIPVDKFVHVSTEVGK